METIIVVETTHMEKYALYLTEKEHDRQAICNLVKYVLQVRGKSYGIYTLSTGRLKYRRARRVATKCETLGELLQWASEVTLSHQVPVYNTTIVREVVEKISMAGELGLQVSTEHQVFKDDGDKVCYKTFFIIDNTNSMFPVDKDFFMHHVLNVLIEKGLKAGGSVYKDIHNGLRDCPYLYTTGFWLEVTVTHKSDTLDWVRLLKCTEEKSVIRMETVED